MRKHVTLTHEKNRIKNSRYKQSTRTSRLKLNYAPKHNIQQKSQICCIHGEGQKMIVSLYLLSDELYRSELDINGMKDLTKL